MSGLLKKDFSLYQNNYILTELDLLSAKYLNICKNANWYSVVFYVSLSVYPHRAGWKVSLSTVTIEPATFGILISLAGVDA
jgi:hypothetical protein